MGAYLLDWVALFFRWFHVIAGIAWIGASFYFVWLDLSLRKPPQWKADKGISGDLWAPVYSMAKHWLSHPDENDNDVDIAFLHIARSPEETIYYDQLETFDAVYPNFQLTLLLKNNGGTSHPQGRLNADWLQELVPDFKQRTVYLCGPSQFMQDVRGYLSELGFDMANFYQESFTPATSEQPEALDETVSIFVPDFAQTIDAPKGQVLADALEGAGLPLIVACRSGICGSCKCKVRKGSVSSTSLETLTPEEIEQGYVLACSSTIEADLEVQIG